MTASAKHLFRFRPLQPADLDRLYQWLQEPHVARWWGDFSDRGRFELHFMEQMESDWRFPNLAVLGQKPVGYMQYDVAALRAGELGLAEAGGVLGLEFLLGDRSLLGKGLGRALVMRAIDLLFREPAIRALVADLAPENEIARKVLSGAGFALSQNADHGRMIYRLNREDQIVTGN